MERGNLNGFIHQEMSAALIDKFTILCKVVLMIESFGAFIVFRNTGAQIFAAEFAVYRNRLPENLLR